MNPRRILEWGGLAAGVILIAFGIGALAMSINARNTVSDELTREYIAGGEDMAPAPIAAAAKQAGLPASTKLPTCDVAGKEIKTGDDARCFAQYMRIHALEASGGLTYAQLGRYVAAADPTNPKGTSDAAAAKKDEKGQPVANAARNTWVTQTALATALNVSYMAEQIALFGLVVGVALLLSGIGFIILALIVFGGARRQEKMERARTVPPTAPVTG